MTRHFFRWMPLAGLQGLVDRLLNAPRRAELAE
jgi:hypothetical protein